MANQVVPQVDIGALTLGGLSAFAPLLAALSADNVAPTAMLQMKALGGCFLTSGPYAAKVPDYLRRCTSVRLDRLAMSVGWRKGDAVSYMADSAGGQAVSLLALCLFSVCNEVKAADALHDLSLRLLPRDTAIASVSQLLEVGRLMKSKLDALGFGNVLAQQVSRVHDVYQHLGKDMPRSFWERPSADALAELLACVSQALREGQTLVRITGSSCMAAILAIAITMFPQDTLVTVEGFVICEGLRKSILIEIGDGHDAESRSQVETVLGTHPLSLISQARGETHISRYGPKTTFTWKNWLADFLQLEFLERGLSCTPHVLTACCNLLVLVPAKIVPSPEHPRKASLDSLGPNPQRRMRDCCQSVFGSAPVGPRLDVKTAFSDLVKAMDEATSTLPCCCEGEECRHMSRGWRQTRHWAAPNCELKTLWYSIGHALEAGFLSFFVNAGPNATCFRLTKESFGSGNYTPVALCIERELGVHNQGEYGYQIWRALCAMFSEIWSDRSIAEGSGSCVIFPSTLRTFRIPPDLLLTFDLIEGQFNSNGRYYTVLTPQDVPKRETDRMPAEVRKKHLVPSNHGEHSELLLTVRERIRSLEIRATVRFAGKETDISLYFMLSDFWLLQKTQPCDHSMSTPLEAGLDEEVVMASVADPFSRQARVAVVQTLHNDEARFLSCRSHSEIPDRARILLLNDCCLNCAVRQAKDHSFEMIIV